MINVSFSYKDTHASCSANLIYCLFLYKACQNTLNPRLLALVMPRHYVTTLCGNPELCRTCAFLSENPHQPYNAWDSYSLGLVGCLDFPLSFATSSRHSPSKRLLTSTPDPAPLPSARPLLPYSNYWYFLCCVNVRSVSLRRCTRSQRGLTSCARARWLDGGYNGV